MSQNARATAGSQQMPCAHLLLCLYFPTLQAQNTNRLQLSPVANQSNVLRPLCTGGRLLTNFDSVQHLSPSVSLL